MVLIGVVILRRPTWSELTTMIPTIHEPVYLAICSGLFKFIPAIFCSCARTSLLHVLLNISLNVCKFSAVMNGTEVSAIVITIVNVFKKKISMPY